MFTSFAKRRTGKSCIERQTNVLKRSKKCDARAVLLPVFFLTLSLSSSMPYHVIFLISHPFQACRAKFFPSVVADDPFQFYCFPIGLVQRRSFHNYYCCVLTQLVQLKIEQRVKKNIENYLKEKYIIIIKFPLNGDQQIQVVQNTKEKLTSHVPKLTFGGPCQTMTSFFKFEQAICTESSCDIVFMKMKVI